MSDDRHDDGRGAFSGALLGAVLWAVAAGIWYAALAW